MTRLSFAALAFLLACGSASPAADSRIRSVRYSEEQVVSLPVAAGYAAVIELAPDEVIDSVIVGNSGVWQITETQTAGRVVVKPLSGAVPTNMVVLTDRR